MDIQGCKTFRKIPISIIFSLKGQEYLMYILVTYGEINSIFGWMGETKKTYAQRYSKNEKITKF